QHLNAYEGFAHRYELLRKQYFACRIVQKIIYNFPQKIVFVLLDPVAQKNLGQMLLATHLQEQHLFLFFVCLFFVNRLCLLHVRYNLYFYRFVIYNFYVFSLFFYFLSFFFIFFFFFYISFFFLFLFFVILLFLFHVRYYLFFYRFFNHNFHVFSLCQYLHSFYFLALFDYEIACLLVQVISLFAFYKLHNSYVNRSFLGGTNVRHFCFFRQPL